MANEEAQVFLRDLWQLCRKHKAEISGCGCCNSPWVGIDIGTPAELRFSVLSVSDTGASIHLPQEGRNYSFRRYDPLDDPDAEEYIIVGSGGVDASRKE